MTYYSYKNTQTLDTDPEAIVDCPFDVNHRMPSRTFASHIQTCPKRPDYPISQCPFNSRHVFDSRYPNDHLDICPDKKTFIEAGLEDDVGEIVDFKSFKHAERYAEDENWDKDDKPTQYKPSQPATQEKKRTLNENLHAIPQNLVDSVVRKSLEEHGVHGLLRTDYVSMLNLVCVSLKDKAPSYCECPSHTPGSFGSLCTIRGQKIRSHGAFKTKKAAKQNSAMWGLVFINNKYLPEPYRMDVLTAAMPDIKSSTNSAPSP
ncbi:Gametocyte-specific factor 1 [Thelohanellus kitauei]|uniref:Gametocyte-specific factor 1 n=1 Tax=Thelohanellus kitauei TaxID=669202 RepID=A0A0C2M449_THEKT|nr:Gametocyte-specific factor 1 [Thelohanellus kitauei]